MKLENKIKLGNTLNSTGLKGVKTFAGLFLLSAGVAVVGACLQDSSEKELYNNSVKEDAELFKRKSNNNK